MERRGIATVSLSSAYSITAAVLPPRAVFVDFPLGHTAGKRGDQGLQRSILLDALTAIEEIDQPGAIRALPYRWEVDDSWKEAATRPRARRESGSPQDDRVGRDAQPQYQFPEDREAAEGSPPTG